MTRILNFILAGLLVTAAIAVYSIKYEATLQAEKVAKLRRAIDQERMAIATLRAEWAFLMQPDRLTGLAERHLDLKPMKMTQVVKLADLPIKAPKGDLIAQKLQGLGLDKVPDDMTGSTQ